MNTPWWQRTVRIDVIEMALVAALLSVLLLSAWSPRAVVEDGNPVQSVRELDAFRQAYGPEHYSEREEEWMIRDFFKDRRGGVFVDVGANHYRDASKTYYLESRLGWSGIAIEPQGQFAEDYATHRPRTKFRPFFVSDVSNATAKLYVLNRSSMVASTSHGYSVVGKYIWADLENLYFAPVGAAALSGRP